MVCLMKNKSEIKQVTKEKAKRMRETSMRSHFFEEEKRLFVDGVVVVLTRAFSAALK